MDGYNIIFAWDELKACLDVSLESARLRLAEILSDYRGSTNAEIILVFDAYKVKKNPGTIETFANITVVYTKEAETADHYIEKVASRLSKKAGYSVRVATSDALEQIIILNQGASRVSANMLFHEINGVKRHIRETYIDKKPVKNNLLLDNLDAETAARLEQMRRLNGR